MNKRVSVSSLAVSYVADAGNQRIQKFAVEKP
jgi:hypothetical protein